MIVVFVIQMFLILLGVYYITVFLQVIGIESFRLHEFKLGKAFIPFYYWKKKYLKD